MEKASSFEVLVEILDRIPSAGQRVSCIPLFVSATVRLGESSCQDGQPVKLPDSLISCLTKHLPDGLKSLDPELLVQLLRILNTQSCMQEPGMSFWDAVLQRMMAPDFLIMIDDMGGEDRNVLLSEIGFTMGFISSRSTEPIHSIESPDVEASVTMPSAVDLDRISQLPHIPSASEIAVVETFVCEVGRTLGACCPSCIELESTDKSPGAFID